MRVVVTLVETVQGLPLRLSEAVRVNSRVELANTTKRKPHRGTMRLSALLPSNRPRQGIEPERLFFWHNVDAGCFDLQQVGVIRIVD